MKKSKLIVIAKMTLTIFFIISLLSAVALPKYLNLNKHNEANQCRANQIIVETALACAYAESLAAGSNKFPERITPDMFEDRSIPVCPVHNIPIAFDPTTGHAFCPNYIEAHSRSF